MKSVNPEATVVALVGLVVLAGVIGWHMKEERVIKVQARTLDKVEVNAMIDQARAEAGRRAAAEYVNRLDGVKNAEAVYLDHPAESSFVYRVASAGADGKATFTKRVVMDVNLGPYRNDASDEEKVKDPLGFVFTVTDVSDAAPPKE